MAAPDADLTWDDRSVPALGVGVGIFGRRFEDLDLLPSEALIMRQVPLVGIDIKWEPSSSDSASSCRGLISLNRHKLKALCGPFG